MSDLQVILRELEAYDVPAGHTPLLERQQLVALNKIDVPEAEELAEFVRADIEAMGFRVFEISTVARKGLRELSFALAEIVEADRAAKAVEPEPERIVLRPKAIDDAGFEIKVEGSHEGPVYRILGAKPERWVAQTDFRNDEAVGYLADRLAKLGTEEALLKAGAVAGATVVIGPGAGIVFDWEPTIASAAELVGNRGTDPRLDQSSRRTTQERRDEYHRRMDAKQAARDDLASEREAGLWNDDEGFEVQRWDEEA